MQAGKDDRSLGDLFAELAQEMGRLVRQEIELARTEIGAQATRLGKELGALVLGGAVLHAAFLAVVAGLVGVLAAVGRPWWLAAFLVGLALAAIGFALVARARVALKRADVVPHRTLGTLKEDREWVKEQIG